MDADEGNTYERPGRPVVPQQRQPAAGEDDVDRAIAAHYWATRKAIDRAARRAKPYSNE